MWNPFSLKSELYAILQDPKVTQATWIVYSYRGMLLFLFTIWLLCSCKQAWHTSQYSFFVEEQIRSAYSDCGYEDS